MAERYNPQEIEPKWARRWYESRVFEPDLANAERPFYNLMMFPYPSAEGLHVGNVYAFTGSDIYGRFTRMRGYDVFEPIGFDAFGIHSENFAISANIHPKPLVERNIRRFREQLKSIGGMFDWSHELSTTDPAYYKWTQWLFLQLYKHGLAEHKTAPVHWCPSCKTVLADEQVIGGHCERCDSLVEQRELKQWFFKITKYAQKLLDNLDWIDWSETTKTAQRNWIGRSEGLEVAFGLDIENVEEKEIRVFTTRPDTIYGVTFMVLAPEHPLVARITTPDCRAAVEAYVEKTRRESEMDRLSVEVEKTGVFTGAYCTNLFNGNRVPIFIADYVLLSYGTGAVMGVPAHDQRDFDFAKKYGLPIIEVISPTPEPSSQPLEAAYTEKRGWMVNSGPFTGRTQAEGYQGVCEMAERAGWGTRTVTYRLRDWLISRQRYWGPPIPIIHCDACGAVPVPEEDLPVLLPDVEDFKPLGTGQSPLATVPEFVNTTCPQCNRPARRETDVNDNFLDSAWYFLRYPSTTFDDRPFDPALTKKWLPVDMYIGGNEHAVLHLMYTRFIVMALHDMGLLDFEEPFKKFRAHGLIIKDGAKMSKSRGNVVNPDEYIARYGADTLRMYLMFMGPLDKGGDFSDQGIGGIARFLNRVWDFVEQRRAGLLGGLPEGEALRLMHRTIKKVTEDLENLKYNTAIAALMEYLNALQKQPQAWRVQVETLVLLLAPLTPHLSEELWERLGNPFSVHTQRWPAWDPELARQEEVQIAVQVNGRVRDRITVPVGIPEDEARELALAAPKVRAHIDGLTVRQVIYVPGRLVNVVAS